MDPAAAAGPPLPRRPETQALRIAQAAAAHVPAYARFLRQSGYDARRLRGFADFCALPTMDRTSYLARFRLADRCAGGDVTQAFAVVRSSGTSGQATLWPRLPAQGPANTAAVRANLQEHFQIQQRWTLLVVAAAMGPWAYATGLTQAAQTFFSEPDLRGTVVTPGLDENGTLEFVEELGSYYDQTILASYPALVISLLEAGTRRGIAWPELNAGVVTGGEVATEAQREQILRYLGKDPERLEGYFNAFGTTETGGIFAAESRLCLLIRRLCVRTPALAEALFGTPILPSINQYNPRRHFLQVENDEVLVTMGGAVPLVRYNTHDRGGLLSFEAVVATCRAHGYDLAAELRARGWGPEHIRPLPFLYVHGRSDAIILHGGNLYLDEVAHALEQPALRDTNSGNFEISTVDGAEGRVTVRLTVELREGLAPSADLQALYERRLPEELQRVSARFRAAYAASQGRTAMAVTLVPRGALPRRGPKQQRVVLPHEARQADGQGADGGGAGADAEGADRAEGGGPVP